MKRCIGVLLVILLSPAGLTAQTGDPQGNADEGERSIRTADLRRHAEFLAADDMRGRLAGTPEARKAADYIAAAMEEAGLEPRGFPRKSYFQTFSFPGKTARNVCGVIKGTHPSLKKQYVVLGAHFDHAGMGRFGRNPARRGEVHNGADDNASGTIALLELMEAFAGRPQKRSLLFLAFSAEEWGLHGSRAWVKKPTVKLSSVVAMLNMDMVGRSSNRYLFVGGVHTGKGLLELVRRMNQPFGFDLEVCGGGPGPSDMDPFYRKGIPVLFFTTGLHPQYHTPDDDVELLALDAERDLVRMIYRTVKALANAPKRPRFQTDDRQAMPAGEKGGGRGTDHIYAMLGARARSCAEAPAGGVRLGKLASRSPGGRAGLKRGDVVLKIDGDEIKGKLDLMRRLAAARYGEKVKVSIRRGKRRKTFTFRFKPW